jgi:putative membrane protein
MTIAKVLIAICAALQAWFMILEMVFWSKPLGRKVFNLSVDFAESTKALASNQGLYNGFLAAGFIWALFHQDPIAFQQIAYFFCGCMFMAAVWGAITVSWKIILVQGLPPALAALAIFVVYSRIN